MRGINSLSALWGQIRLLQAAGHEIAVAHGPEAKMDASDVLLTFMCIVAFHG